MVMDEGKVDRAKAVKTLLDVKGDIVNAILVSVPSHSVNLPCTAFN